MYIPKDLIDLHPVPKAGLPVIQNFFINLPLIVKKVHSTKNIFSKLLLFRKKVTKNIKTRYMTFYFLFKFRAFESFFHCKSSFRR